MRRVDSDAKGFHDVVGAAAPEPGAVDEAWEARAAGGLRTVARRAVVAEERRRGGVNHAHQLRIGADLVDRLFLHRLRPPRALLLARLDLVVDVGLLIEAE